MIILAIKKNYVVAKRNVLNEIRANNMTLQELRFFSIYLSKINPKDINTRIVRFSLIDFQKIMELDSHIKIEYIKQVTNSLLCKVINVPKDNGGYEAFQLFKKCVVDIDETGEWYIEINAHDEALPLMFEFKNKYFTYQLWNALRLKSSNQLRMYEILKQYEQIGERVISIEELKNLLGISIKDYNRYDNFKMRVLDGCQEALQQYTDISFTYESTGKKGKGGKIVYLKFCIYKNKNYFDKLSLNDFIKQQPAIDNSDLKNIYTDRLKFMSQACKDEFTIAEIQVLYNLALKILPSEKFEDDRALYDFFKEKYDELNWRSSQAKIHKRFNYLKSLFENDDYEPISIKNNCDKIPKNKFVNYTQRKWDFEEMERMELELLKRRTDD